MARGELNRLSVWQAGALIEKGEISPTELVKSCLEAMRELDHGINAVKEIFADQALWEAAQAEKQIRSQGRMGPLHGVPFAIKDLFASKGSINQAGSRVLQNAAPATRDAFVVERLRRAGAILVGRLNMHELAFGISSRNRFFGDTLNPHDTTRMCGGSSSGSAAALAAHMVPLALGTDTGASIRIPSALCGVTGLKPTYGLLSKSGVVPLAWSLDTVGPMARRVEDLALALAAMQGRDPADPCQARRASRPRAAADFAALPDLEGLKVGVPRGYFFEMLNPEVEALTEAAIKRMAGLGAELREIDLPHIIRADRAAMAILFSEAAACLEIYTREQPQNLGQTVKDGVNLGLTIPASRYIQALRVRTGLTGQLRQLFKEIDIMAVPVSTVAAPPMGAEEVEVRPGLSLDVRTALTRFTRYFNIAGVPVLALPCGKTKGGLPVGIQLAAGYFKEDMLLRAGAALQNSLEESAL